MGKREPERDRTAAGGAGPGAPDSRSVLPAIEARAGAVSRLLLRDAAPTEIAPAVAARAAPPAVPRGRGRYELHGEIGRGGMGVVLRGRDTDLGRDVALKVLDGRLAARPEVVQRFVEEAQIGGQLQHPGIVPVYELGLMSDERPYISMKLVKGRTLAALLDERASPAGDARRLVDIFGSVCQTLAYAHSRGVIHRDVKPANVMVGAFGEVQLVDWGLAKVLRADGAVDAARAQPAPAHSIIATVRSGPDSDGTHSQAGSVLGTPYYMSPEQARGEVERVDERSDVFSLGAILCEILTGKPPYTGNPDEILEAAAAGRLEGARARLAECGAEAGLVAIANACLAAAPDQRPAHAGLVAQRVLAHLASVEERSRQAQVEAAEARVKAAAERRARRLTLALASCIVVTLLLAGGGWAFLSQRAAQRERGAQAAIGSALADAAAERGQGHFSEALGAAERARGLVESGDLGADVATRVAADVAAITAEIQLARERDRIARDNDVLLAELSDVRQPEGDRAYPTDWSRFDRDFAAVFARHGIDAEASAEATDAGALAARGISLELAAALDEWAVVRQRAGNVPGAQRLLQASRELDPDATRSGLRSAAATSGVGALQEFAAREDVGRLPVSTQNVLGQLLAGLGAVDDAAAVFRQAALLHPQDFAVEMHTGRILRLVQPPRLEEAARAYSAALALRPDNRAAANELAITLRALGDLPGGLAVLEAGVARHPDDAHLLGALAKSHHQAGHAEQALAAAQAALALDPGEMASLVVLSNVLHDRGDSAGSLDAARRAAESAPDNAIVHYTLARARKANGDREGAIQSYRRSLEIDPNFSPAHNNLGLLLSAGGDYAGSLAELRKAVESDPRNTNAMGSLAWLLATCPDASIRNCGEALKWARRNVALTPEEPNALNNLGTALGCNGLWSEAIEPLTQSLAHCADAPDDRYLAACDRCLLATARAHCGQIDEARKELARAEAWPATNPDRADVDVFERLLDEARAAVAAAGPASHQP